MISIHSYWLVERLFAIEKSLPWMNFWLCSKCSSHSRAHTHVKTGVMLSVDWFISTGCCIVSPCVSVSISLSFPFLSSFLSSLFSLSHFYFTFLLYYWFSHISFAYSFTNTLLSLNCMSDCLIWTPYGLELSMFLFEVPRACVRGGLLVYLV